MALLGETRRSLCEGSARPVWLPPTTGGSATREIERDNVPTAPDPLILLGELCQAFLRLVVIGYADARMVLRWSRQQVAAHMAVDITAESNSTPPPLQCSQNVVFHTNHVWYIPESGYYHRSIFWLACYVLRIGRATSIALSKAGWSVVLFARREELKSAAAECPTPTLIITFGRLDLLFNNAGIAVIGTLVEDLPLKKYQAVLNVNVVGTFLCTKEAVRQYKEQSPQGRCIINNG
ncbi:hypothetical protein M422DRAFT_265703 [Sphaerobolus stellatus SS14]|uniref:Uncharacterized protein n=1 Tax=Sphaerobolus stellatus (strain SS14) TaxID=990650 RepID=A0A0C9V515_SPHS4|nr:hypothetical protein M422DRAFT_265703 [Sphaerobolus stellatus SS14]